MNEAPTPTHPRRLLAPAGIVAVLVASLTVIMVLIVTGSARRSVDSNQTAPSHTFGRYDTPENVTVAGTPGLLGRRDGGFVVEWGLDDRITVSIDDTDLDPDVVIAAIHSVEEAIWTDLLPDTTPVARSRLLPTESLQYLKSDEVA